VVKAFSLTSAALDEYRKQVFRLLSGQRLKTIDQAIAFVNQLGFIYFWPIKGIVFPSLWAAVAGDRPVADAHDDPGHVTWGWKDTMLGKRVWYYAKILHKKATIISLDYLPYFYALSENYGSPEEDHLTLYEQGRLTLEAKTIYETILFDGPIDTVALRKAVHMTSRESDARFERALVALQVDFKILPVAVTQAGAWKYAFAYDIVPRHLPQILDQAQMISETTARQELAKRYFLSVGAARVADLMRLFGWNKLAAESTIDKLVRSGFLVSGVELEINQAAKSSTWYWYAIKELVTQGDCI
jgi:hypothetical protein